MVEVFTIGGGEYLVNTFNAVAAWTGGGGYRGLIKVALVMGFIYALLIVAFSLDWRAWFNWFLQSTLIYLCLMVPTISVKVTDRINPSLAPATVANVPLGLGVMASFTSQVGDWLTRTAETVFVMPANLNYSSNGFIYGSKLFDAVRSVEITDPIFAANVNEYTKRCVFYDVLLGFKSMQSLANSSDLWRSYGPGSPARGMPFLVATSPDTTQAEIRTCQQAYQALDSQWTSAVLPAERLSFARSIFPKLSPAAAVSKVEGDLPLTVQAFTGLSDNALNILRQHMMLNAFQAARADMSGSAAEASIDSFAVSRSDLQARNTYNIVAQNAMKWVPLLHIVMTVLFYALFPILFPLFLFPRSGIAMLRGYAQGFFFLASWGPIFVILHMILMTRGMSAGVALSDSTGVTLATVAGLTNVTDDLASIAGYMIMSVPVLAFMVARGGMSFGSNAASALAPLGSASEAASAEATTGSYAYGNVSYAMRQGNKSDFAPSYIDGFARSSFVGSNGVTTTTNADGTRVINQQPGISALESKFTLTESEVGEMRSAASAFQTRSTQLSERASDSWSASNVYGSQIFSTMQTSRGRDSVTGTAEQRSISEATNFQQSMADRLVNEYGFSKRAANALAAESFVSGGLGLSARARWGKSLFAGVLSGELAADGNYTQGARNGRTWTSEASASENLQKGLDLVDSMSRSTQATSARENFFRATATSSDSDVRGLTERRDASISEAKSFERQASKLAEEGRRFDRTASYAEAHGLQVTDDMSQSWVVFQQRELARNPSLGANGYDPSLLDHQLTDSQRRTRDALATRFVDEIMKPARDLRDGIQPFPASDLRTPSITSPAEVQSWGRGQLRGTSSLGPAINVDGDPRDAGITTDVANITGAGANALRDRSALLSDTDASREFQSARVRREVQGKQDKPVLTNLPLTSKIFDSDTVDVYGPDAKTIGGVPLKKGVDATYLDRNMSPVPSVVSKTASELGLPPTVITSALDGEHSRGSLHYRGKALDFRGNNITPTQGDQLADSVRRRLGSDYQVKYEMFPDNPVRNHLHVQYRPKQETPTPTGTVASSDPRLRFRK